MRQRDPLGMPRLAHNKTEAARVLGVSVDFFDEHIAHELKCVRRGKRRLYPHWELVRWLDAEAEFVLADIKRHERLGFA